MSLISADARAVHAAVAAFGPELIINAAAYTAVDKAESEPFLVDAINAQAPQYLAEAAHALDGCRLIQISTDYVFDGHGSTAYKPDDAPHPLSVYGRTKLAGEQAVLAALGPRAVVLRTAWVYAPAGKNFLLTMLRLMRERGAVRVVADQKGSPTAAFSIARALWRTCRNCRACTASCTGPMPGWRAGTNLPARLPKTRWRPACCRRRLK